MGAFLSSINAGRAPPSQIIDVMSIYHPFPLRLDSLNKGAPVQYDACLQLGEFPSDKYKGNSEIDNTVFSTPSKKDDNSAKDLISTVSNVTSLVEGISKINGLKELPGVGPAVDLVEYSVGIGEVIDSEPSLKLKKELFKSSL
jgi:hypothetical protein